MEIVKIAYNKKGTTVEAKVGDSTVIYSKKSQNVSTAFIEAWFGINRFIDSTQLGHQDNITLTTLNIKSTKKGVSVTLSGTAQIVVGDGMVNTTFNITKIDADMLATLPALLDAAEAWINGVKDQLDLFAEAELVEQHSEVFADGEYDGPDETERVEKIRAKRVAKA